MTEKKPRWSPAKKASAKKASAKKAQTEKAKGRPAGKKFGDGPPAKKPRWVDGAPARPAAADRGKPRWARDEAAGREGGGRVRDARGYNLADNTYPGRDDRDRSARSTLGDRNDRGAGGGYRSREDVPSARDERGGYRGRDDRNAGGGGYRGRDDRASYRDRDDRNAGSGGYRGRDDRPSYRDRDDRKSGSGGYRGRDDRASYRDRDDRKSGSGGGYRGRDDRASYRDRDDRNAGTGGYRGRDDRPSYRDRDDRKSGSGGGYRGRDDRPSYRDRDDRSGRSGGGYRGRDERPSDRDRGDRPRHGDRRNDERSGGYRSRDDQPSSRDRDERPRGDRPAYGNQGERRDDRNRGQDDRRDFRQRDDRPGYGDRGPRRPTGRYSDGPHHEPRPVRADRARGQWGVDASRPTDRVVNAPERVASPADQPDAITGPETANPVGPGADSVPATSSKPEPRGAIEPMAESAPSPATGTAPEPHGPSFADLGLPEAIVKALAARGIRSPFPIQAATIPDALAAKDLLGRGRTGSGKTMAFGLPTLARLSQGRTTPNRPRALVLVPTRELALQVADALEPIARAAGVSQKVVAGGMPYPPQLTALDRGVDVVVATPGRLQDLIERGAAILDNVEIVVLDEADHMADLGFLPEVTEIMDLVPEGGQRLLFSATLDKGIDELAQKYLVDPVTHSTDDPTAAVSTMDHRVLLIEPSMKKTLTAQISGRPGRTLIFVRTQLGADRVASQLRESGILAGPIHGGLNQSVRNKVLEAFKDGRLQVLVATDVAARGIHVDDVTQVVQVDPPADHKTYVHRAGRTARAGSEGSVVTLALPHQRKGMERIIDEVALSIRPERLDARSAADEGVEPTGAPVPESVWQDIIAPRPNTRFKGRGRGPGRPRPDGGLRPRRRF